MASLLTNDGLQDIWSTISCYTNIHIVNRVVQAIFFSYFRASTAISCFLGFYSGVFTFVYQIVSRTLYFRFRRKRFYFVHERKKERKKKKKKSINFKRNTKKKKPKIIKTQQKFSKSSRFSFSFLCLIDFSSLSHLFFDTTPSLWIDRCPFRIHRSRKFFAKHL